MLAIELATNKKFADLSSDPCNAPKGGHPGEEQLPEYYEVTSNGRKVSEFSLVVSRFRITSEYRYLFPACQELNGS